MIRFAICDDDETIAGELDSLIMSLLPLYGQEFEISVFFSGESFCKHLNETGEVFDIVLMDIEMRGITGIEAGTSLREDINNDRTLLIFVSCHKNYYHEIIDLNVFCFIPKPISSREFNLKLGKAISRVIREHQNPSSIDFIVNKQGHEIHIPISSIMYLESDARQIHLHTATETHTYYGRLDEEEKKLPEHSFSRIHKSYLINFAHAINITAKDITMKDSRQFHISEKYRQKVKMEYLRYREGEK